MAELAGQLALFDTQSFPTMLDAEAYEVAYCPACHTNWGAENARAKPTVQARIEREHEMMTDGRCAYMHQHGITEPFYTMAEIALVRAGGWPCPYPRPRGFTGLYQVGSA